MYLLEESIKPIYLSVSFWICSSAPLKSSSVISLFFCFVIKHFSLTCKCEYLQRGSGSLNPQEKEKKGEK